MTQALEGRAGPVEQVQVHVLAGATLTSRSDYVVGEEPLEMRLGAPGSEPAPVAVTMRTPGHDFELAVGFLLSEGLLASMADLRSVRYCDLPEGDPQRYNVVTVTGAVAHDAPRRRATTVTAACGVCGTATLDDLRGRCPAVPKGHRVAPDLLTSLPDRLRKEQRMFERTGGLHAAGLYEHTGRLLAVREDVGRHNAVDKLVGWSAMQGRLPLSTAMLVVSGRVSFEIVQKAAVAGVPIVVAVSAPSSLAVDTAHALGMTLAGFVRDGRANIYSAPWRLSLAEAS